MSAAAEGRILVGTSGWRYPSWRGAFYPPDLVQRRELEYISRQLATVEINGSFYSLQRPDRYRAWRDATPDDFVFGVKGGRFITHMLRMRNARTALANFLASGVLLLGGKLGPILWQLPERIEFDPDVLEDFCAMLPTTIGQASALAGEHDSKVPVVALPETGAKQAIRYAFEPRHTSFDCDECEQVLRRHGIALVTADSGGTWPMMTRVTTDFVYLRLHGSPDVYASGYSRDRLRRWASKARGWAHGEAGADGIRRDVYVYFDNDQYAHAPFDAKTLADLVARAG